MILRIEPQDFHQMILGAVKIAGRHVGHREIAPRTVKRGL